MLRVNDPATAERFSRMMGKKIKMKKVKGPDGKEKEEPSEEDLYSVMDLMTLNVEKQLVLFQGHYNHPIEADQERHYKNKSPIEKMLHSRVMMGAASPIPEYMIPAQHRALGYTGAPRVFDPKTQEVKVLAE